MSHFFKVFKEFIIKLPGAEDLRKIYKRFIEYRNPRIFGDKWSSSYDTDPYVSSVFDNDFYILEKIKRVKARKVLEVGCGTGRSLKLLLENFNANFMGIDFSYEMCKKLNEKIRTNIYYKRLC